MLFIKHFFTFIFAFLVFGSMALPIEEVFPGKVYIGNRDWLNPTLHVSELVHVLSVIL
jgi:hypothetical protein